MKKLFSLVILLSILLFPQQNVQTNPPIYIAFLWHMHQPIYWPYESIIQTDDNHRYDYSVTDIHNQRTGPYTSWPKDAVQTGIDNGLQHLGAQVSFSGSLIENLNNLQANGNGNFQNWKSSWNNIKNQKTSLNNPRIDMVGSGYFHPLMGLIGNEDIRKQIQFHKKIMSENFSGEYSKGIFPPENAFSERMIPALTQEGINWVLIDNIHFDRACQNYPWNSGGNIYEPNKADILNPDPNDWIQLNNLWAPTKNSAAWGRRPHYAQYIDPVTGQSFKIIVVPTDRYLGNEDGRGGFGALNYEAVLSQLESYNTDPEHPILVVLHHDGDNYGGGSESYYHSNFTNFVNWLKANPDRFVCTTVEDYLQMFPPEQNDIIHIEDGSWSGADNGDPEFKKWLGDPDGNGYSPDRNSWAVITAAKNFVLSCDSTTDAGKNAWKYLLVGESSDYWYWDGAQGGIWDSHPTRAANQSIQFAQQVLNQNDFTPPTIFSPQREPYNPGGTEWGISQTNNLTIWTYAFDVNGLKSVQLKYRIDNDGINSNSTNDNEIYSGGNDVGNWITVDMIGNEKPSNTNPQPLFKAKEYSAQISNLNNVLIDYYVEAIDNNNNVEKSPILHVWIGENNSGGGNTNVSWMPVSPTINDTIKIKISNANKGAKLHWGVNNSRNNWQTPNQVYWTEGTTLFNGTGPAVESPFNGPDEEGNLSIKIGPFNNSAQVVERVAFVIHYDDDSWDNNNGNDYNISFTNDTTSSTFIMDGNLDNNSFKASSNNNADLYIGWNGDELYVATQSAFSQGKDVFIFIADSTNELIASPWAKTGSVAKWKAFLANESTNNYVTWTDDNGLGEKNSGSFLEGKINIKNLFGYIPDKIYISVGQYQTQDAGNLVNQVPSGNNNSNIELNEFYTYDFSITSINDKEIKPISHYELLQNYPNPFNPNTIISYQIPDESYVTLKIYDILGREIATLVNERKNIGKYSIEFSADSKNLSSGIYFYELIAQPINSSEKTYRDVKKLILMK